MAHEVVILEGAESDLFRAYILFEERAIGVGDRFLNAFERAADQLAQFPESAPKVSGPFRRKLIMLYPYGLYYEIAGRRIIVHAVLNLRQNPDLIRRRLEDL